MDIIWEGDLVNKKRFFSEKVYDILGYKNSEMEELDAWFNIVHPEDIKWVKKGIKQQVEGKSTYTFYHKEMGDTKYDRNYNSPS